MTELRLMAVHAHPDDESSKGAATCARYAAEGHRVQVVTLGDVQPLPTIENSRELVRIESGIVVDVAPDGNEFNIELMTP